MSEHNHDHGEEVNTDRCPRCGTALSQKQLERAFPSTTELNGSSGRRQKAETLSVMTCDGCGAELEYDLTIVVEGPGRRQKMLTTVGVLDGWEPDSGGVDR